MCPNFDWYYTHIITKSLSQHGAHWTPVGHWEAPRSNIAEMGGGGRLFLLPDGGTSYLFYILNSKNRLATLHMLFVYNYSFCRCSMYAFHVLPSWSHAYSLVEADSHVQNLIGDTKCQSSTSLVAIGSVFTQKKRRNFFSAWTLIGCLSVDRTWKLLLGLLNQKVSQSVLMLDIYWCNNVFWTKFCFWIGSSGALPINKTIFF